MVFFFLIALCWVNFFSEFQSIVRCISMGFEYEHFSGFQSKRRRWNRWKFPRLFHLLLAKLNNLLHQATQQSHHRGNMFFRLEGTDVSWAVFACTRCFISSSANHLKLKLGFGLYAITKLFIYTRRKRLLVVRLDFYSIFIQEPSITRVS